MTGGGSAQPGRASVLLLTGEPLRGQRLVARIARLAPQYDVRLCAPASAGEVDEAIHAQVARLVLLDVDFAARLGPQALLQASRGHPQVPWVLLWNEPPALADSLVKCTGASGCLEWGSDGHSAVRCIEAVLSGDLWLPRRMLRVMVASLHKGLRPSDVECAAPGDAGEPLTGREMEALELVGHGLTNKHIALRLGISVNTVKKHLKQAFKKRGFHSRRQLLA